MKKTIAIALAFVMVFAIAATAFAGIGFGAVTTPKGPDVKVAVTLYDIGEDDAGNPMLVKHPSTKGILAGYDLVAIVAVTIPAKYETINDALKVTVTNIEGVEPEMDSLALVPQALLVNADNVGTWEASKQDMLDMNKPSKTTTYEYLFEFTAKATKDVKVTAVYSKAGLTDDIHDEGLTINRGGKDYVVLHEVMGGGDVTDMAAATDAFVVINGDEYVTFTTEKNDGDNNYPVNGVFYFDGRTPFTVAIMDGVVAFRPEKSTSWLYPADDGYAALKKGFDGIMNALGFSMTAGKFGVLNDAGFEAMAGSVSAVKASGTFYAYTQTLTVPGTAKVPDTGDVNVAGIVMIAIAIVAGAAVVIRKVRA
ncbi:MAG: hypothetical protein RR232_08415 [Clostridia bacterium]